MTETIPTSEVLNRAADLIEERGWLQGEGWGVEHESSGLCLEGGVIAALGLDAEDSVSRVGRDAFRACPAYVAVGAYLGESCLFLWNDARERTAAEVIEVLRACAVIEATKERAGELIEVSA